MGKPFRSQPRGHAAPQDRRQGSPPGADADSVAFKEGRDKLTASDRQAGDTFGTSVAVSGETVVVGAFLDDFGDTFSAQGSAYVFVKPATGWTSTSTFDAKLTASDGAASDQFGSSVALSGDTVVVGAWGDVFGAGPFQGSAYVFVQPDPTPPVTSIGVSPIANGNGWHNGTVTFSVSAEDEADGSGVAETRCALDPTSAPANFDDLPAGSCGSPSTSADGQHTLYAASRGNAGNKETPVSETLRIDGTKPSPSATRAPPANAQGWTTPM